MRNKTIIILALFSVWITAQPAFAGDFDGTKPLICAVIRVLECPEEGSDCEWKRAQDIDVPQFIKINFEEKVISGTGTKGQFKSAKYENMVFTDGRLILQGIQNGRAWSMVIKDETGRMNVSAVDDQVAFIIFGACTPQ